MIALIIAAIIAGVLCYAWGFRNGKADQLQESERTATKIARRRAMLSPAEDY